MPNRWVTTVVVLCWLACTGWLLWHDVRPRWLSGEPPPWLIERIDQSRQRRPDMQWYVSKNGARLYTLRTWASFDERADAYSVQAELKKIDKTKAEPGRLLADSNLPLLENAASVLPIFNNVSLLSTYSVNLKGQTSQLTLHTEYDLAEDAGRFSQANNLQFDLRGEVKDGAFHWSRRISNLSAKSSAEEPAVELASLPVSSQGMVLNPFHPFSRYPKLLVGQVWEVPALDPWCTGALLERVLDSDKEHAKLELLAPHVPLLRPGVQRLKATVGLPEQPFLWNGDKRAVWEVRYRSSMPLLEITVMVRQSDGLVLEQQVNLWWDHWVLTRSSE